MDAGKLDRRIKLLEPVRGKDPRTGAATGTGFAVRATVWARRIPGPVAERVLGSGVVSAEDVVFSIRWRDDIDATWRVREGDVEYEVLAVPSGYWRKFELLVHCATERPNRGIR